jgi:hypothetical protein
VAAKYRKIDPRIWADERFAKMSTDCKCLALYCLTCQQTNRIGLFHFSPALAAEQLDTVSHTLSKRIETVCRTLKWRFDDHAKVLYMPTWWKYNHPDNQKHLQGCLEDLHDVPQTVLLKEFISNKRYIKQTYHSTFEVGIAYRIGDGMAYQEQEQEQEQEQDTPKPPLGDLPVDLDNEEFKTTLADWIAYKGKKYKPQGMRSLVSRASTLANRHGLSVVIEAFRTAMANGWQGWDQPSIFDKAPLRPESRLPTAADDAKWSPHGDGGVA